MPTEPTLSNGRSRQIERHSPEHRWASRRDVALTTLAWLTIVVALLWAAGHIARTLLMVVVAGLIAYALYPAVKLLSRYLPRPLAILLVYLGLMVGLGLLIYLILTTAVDQISRFASEAGKWLTPGPDGKPSPLLKLLSDLGVTQAQIDQAQQLVVTQAEALARNLLPLVSGTVNAVLDVVLTAILSVYLLVDGRRLGNWLRTRVPLSQRERVDFLLEAQQRVVGGYIRGQLLISTTVGVLVAAGMYAFHVPFAILLGVLAFVLVFIPVIGTIASGAACVLVALTQGWVIALAVLGYFVGLHVLMDDFISPRVMGRSVGIHPAVSIVALVAGGEIFGLWGALLASPLAGLLQAVAAYAWIAWRETHKDQYPDDDEQPPEKVAPSRAPAASAPGAAGSEMTS